MGELLVAIDGIMHWWALVPNWPSAVRSRARAGPALSVEVGRWCWGDKLGSALALFTDEGEYFTAANVLGPMLC